MIELRWYNKSLVINKGTEFENFYEDKHLQMREVCSDGRVIRDWQNIPVVHDDTVMESTHD
jgi:hypothetical protein